MKIVISESELERIKSLINEVESSDEVEQFAETRLKGAKKITDNAHEKGGLSMLTYQHYKVKLPYYEKASKGKLELSDAKKEYKELLSKLYSSTKGGMNIEQIEFQKLVGKIEVLGELIIRQEKS